MAIITTIVTTNIGTSTIISEVSSFPLIIITPLIADIGYKTTYRLIKKMLFSLAVIVIVTAVLMYSVYFIQGDNGIIFIHKFSRQFELGFIGFNSGMNLPFFVPNIYFRWSMWLIPAVIFHANEKRIYVIMIAVLLTLSTAVILFSLMGLLYLYLRRNRKKMLMMTSLLALSLIIIVITPSLSTIFQNVLSKFTATDASTSVKLEHIRSMIPLIFKLPNFFIGMGLGSEFYTTGIDGYTSFVEVSHLNMMRQFGVVTSLIFFAYVISVAVSNMTHKDTEVFGLSLILLFISTGTNPLLLSPILFLFLIISRQNQFFLEQERSKIFKENKNRNLSTIKMKGITGYTYD